MPGPSRGAGEVPLAPRTARAIDLVVGERCDGPIFVGANGERIDRHSAGRIVRRIARRAGIAKCVGLHTLRHAFITAAIDAGVPLRDVQVAASHADPRTAMRYDRGESLPRPARHLHRRDIPRRRQPLTPFRPLWPATTVQSGQSVRSCCHLRGVRCCGAGDQLARRLAGGESPRLVSAAAQRPVGVGASTWRADEPIRPSPASWPPRAAVDGSAGD
jgi:Phage integrase family